MHPLTSNPWGVLAAVLPTVVSEVSQYLRAQEYKRQIADRDKEIAELKKRIETLELQRKWM